MTPVEVLRGAKEVLATPERWTQGSFARDNAGCVRYPSEPFAVCWCVSGAVQRVINSSSPVYGVFTSVIGLLEAAGHGHITIWNDTPGRTHAEVIELIDRAIELGEANQ